MSRIWMLAIILLAPLPAAADYLYGVFSPERMPHVLVVVDSSAGMASDLSGVKGELEDLVPRLDGVLLGFSRAGAVGSATCSNDIDDALLATSRTQQRSWLSTLTTGSGNLPLATALDAVREEIDRDADGDKSRACRPYHVILIVGAYAACESNASEAEIVKDVTELRTKFSVQGKDLNVKTYVLAVGAGGAASASLWDKVAAAGGTGSTARYASTPGALREHFDAIFGDMLSGEYAAMAPVIDTVPLIPSEVGKVSRNFMTYASFRMPGQQGHLYGIRLFKESPEGSGTWLFTDFTKLNLDTCGQNADNPCVFDAGQRLKSRVSLGTDTRRILTATALPPRGQVSSAFTVPLDPTPIELSSTTAFATAWSAYVTHVATPVLGTTELAALAAQGPTRSSEILAWLHGSSRDWPLGDFYHAGPTVVGPPSYSYKIGSYVQFRTKTAGRPTMIYVGANDGMIHAFHAADDFGATPTYAAGDEAWAYVPVSQLAQLANAVEGQEQRFFSQDLSCRVDDVLVDEGADCNQDIYCGWRTLLLCGQGWGGSWYVTLDITDPLQPKPLWEATHGGTKGLGRSWSLPGLALVRDEGKPIWAAVLGSGYNSDMACAAGTTGCRTDRNVYRILNEPFAGAYPQHGNGTDGDPGTTSADGTIYILDMATGDFLGSVTGTSGTIVADTAIVDVDLDGWSDTMFAGTWNSQIDQVSIDHDADGKLEFGLCKSVRQFSGASNKAISTGVSALINPDVDEIVHLFVGAGVDAGPYPDQQMDAGNRFDFGLFDVRVDIDGGVCEDSNSPSTLCTEGTTFAGIFSNGQRLVGSPVLVLREFGQRWLTFSAWEPPDQPCDAATTRLHCVDVSEGTTCAPCGGVAGGPTTVATYTNQGRPPTSPTSADGQLYLVTPTGPQRVGNQTGGAGVGGNANSTAPGITAIVSWREIFD